MNTLLRIICCVSVLLLLFMSGAEASAAVGTFIPATNRTDMVYDDTRGVLYITNGSSILRYQTTTNTFLSPYTFNAGNLAGIDLSPDGNTLAIADRNITGIHLVDLQTDTIKPDIMFTPASYEGGTFTVAYGNDGWLLVTTQFNGSGGVPLRRVDPATGAITTIKSSIDQDSMLSSSADGSCIGIAENNDSRGPVDIYNVATKGITKTANTDWYNYEIGTNRDCSQFAVPVYGGTFIYDQNLSKLGTIGVYAGGQPIGVVYSPVSDIVYFAWVGTSEVRAYDSKTFAQLASFNVGDTFQSSGNYAFNRGRLKTSRDGSLLFATVTGGVRSLSTSLNPVANTQSIYTRSSSTVSVTLTGSSPKLLPLTYSVLTQPAHGTIQGTAPNLSYTPAPGYSGPDSFTFTASDGTLQSSPATVTITVDLTLPTITSFTMPEVSSTLTVAVSSLTATDNDGISDYCVAESANPAVCSWSPVSPASYHFSGIGTHTAYAFARDHAGNISIPVAVAVSIPEIVPRITLFSIPPTYGYQSLTIPVTFTASDDLGVTGYCITETTDPASCSWTGSAPSSYTLAAPGPHTLYAFARNSTGKVSAAASASTIVVGQVNFIPAAGRIDMAYDTARDMVYITSGTKVLRFQLSTQSFLPPYTFGLGNLYGIDISPDGTTLAIADKNIPGIHLVDLLNNTIKPDIMFTPSYGEGGTYSVAFGNDGALLVTSTFNGSGWVPLRRVDPATGAVTVVKNMISQDSMLSASADGKCIAYEESNSSNGPLSIYDVATKSITKTVATNWFTYEVGTNRDCSQFAVPTYGGTFIYDKSLTKLGTIGVYASGQPIGVAYSPIADIVYFAWVGSHEVRAYNTATFAQIGSYDVGYTFQNTGNYAFNQGHLKTSRDGSLFFVTIQDGIRYQRLGTGAPIADNQTVTAYAGTALPITLTGSAPGQATLSYTITTPPAHGSLQGSAPNLTYTPDPGFTGTDSITFKLNDGSQDSNAGTLTISIKSVPSAVTVIPPSTNGQLTLTWTNPVEPDFNHIHIYRSTVSGVRGTLIADNLIATTYTDTGLASLTTYYYTVRSVDTSGYESNNINQTAQKTLDATPPITTVTPPAGTYSQPQGATLFCSDNSGGACTSTYYCLGAGCNPATLYAGETIPIAGSMVLRYFSIDQAGNIETVKSASYTVQPRYITASPSNINFGSAFLYYPSSRTVTIMNAGSQPLTIGTPPAITGTDSAQFSVAPGGATPCQNLTPTIAPGTSCTLTVTFTPNLPGIKQSNLTLTSNADNSPVTTIPLSGMGIPPLYLTTTISGSGSINNITQSPAFTCDAPTCIAPFAAGTILQLHATPSALYTFTGWSGTDCNGTSDCILNLIANTTVTAVFSPRPLIRLDGSATPYLTFADAIFNAAGAATLKSRNVAITENIHIDQPREITLIGGFTEDFTAGGGFTVINGTLTISQGRLKLQGVVLR